MSSVDHQIELRHGPLNTDPIGASDSRLTAFTRVISAEDGSNQSILTAMTSVTPSTGTPALDLVNVPRRERAPFTAIMRRIAFAIGLVVFVALVVRIGRDGYTDVTGNDISFLDALYYASVTVTTTGYGDITAVSSGARQATVLLITPARILFLILVVSTTVEVLTDQTRELIQKRRWRQQVNDHTVICGYGATGASAAADLISRGLTRATSS